MRILYYNFYGMPARITLGGGDTPELCEMYDAAADAFIARNELTLDVYDTAGSHLIPEEEFRELLARARAARQS